MKVEFFDLSNVVSTKLIIINTAHRVALCLRGSSLQVIMVRLIICDGFFMRSNRIEWRKKTFAVATLGELHVFTMLISEHQ